MVTNVCQKAAHHNFIGQIECLYFSQSRRFSNHSSSV